MESFKPTPVSSFDSLGCKLRYRDTSQASKQYWLAEMPTDNVALTAATNNETLASGIQVLARELILDVEETLHSLEQEISRVETYLENLYERQGYDLFRLGLYKSAVGSHRLLPDDVILEIFRLCIDEVVVPRKRDIAEPWNILHVCSKWRHLLLTTPTLWTKVHIYYKPKFSPNDLWSYVNSAEFESYMKSFEEGVDNVLSRGRRSQFALRLDSGNIVTGPGPLPVLVPHLGRVRQFQMIGNPYILDYLPRGTPLSSLETVAITGTETVCRDHVDVFRSEMAPNLRELTLAYHHTPVASNLLNLPLSQLTTLKIPFAKLSISLMLNILSRCRNIVECRLSLSQVAPPPEPTPPVSSIITLPNLSVLELELELDREVNAQALTRLHLPALRQAKFSGFMKQPRWIGEMMRGSSHLESLTLDLLIKSPVLERILQEVPSLQSFLILAGPSLSSSTLEQMGLGELLPNLTSLYCRIGYSAEGFHEALDLHLDMLERRRSDTTAATHIGDVHISFGRNRIESVTTELARLLEMAQNGWNLTYDGVNVN